MGVVSQLRIHESGNSSLRRHHSCSSENTVITRNLSIVLLSAIAQIGAAQPDLSGIWMLNGRATERELLLTPLGEQLQADYDLLEDDPSLYCVPASTSRVWANPNVRIEIAQRDDRIDISYEFFDLRREIPLGDESVLPRGPSTRNISGTFFPEMGSSIARYEGDRLIIESSRHAAGIIRTSRGVPQSDNTITTEELWVEGDTLFLEHTYLDTTLFEEPFVLDYRFRRLDEDEIGLYECTEADYDWFEELNAPEEEEAA